MSCPDDARLERYLSEANPPAELEAHIASCESCRGRVQALSKAQLASGADATGTFTSPLSKPEPARSQLPKELAPGGKVDRYRVLSLLGEGGMGVVFAAYDEELDRKVALKLLVEAGSGHRPEMPSEGHVRLLREAQSMARLTHPNVVAIHDVLTPQLTGSRGPVSPVIMVMEFVDGMTLRQWNQQTNRDWHDVVRLFEAAGRGLQAAHDKGIVHRDFKPDNVLVGKDGNVRVADFGIARDQAQRDAPELRLPPSSSLESSGASVEVLTRAGQILGTPAYMAPEHIRGADIDARTDQFAFCVALYEALTGIRPFQAPTLKLRLDEITAGRIKPPPAGVRVPSWVVDVVRRGLSPAKESRYPGLADLLVDLRRDPAVRRRRGALAVTTALLAVGALTVGIRAEHQRRHQCDGSEALVAPVWNSARSAEIRGRFLGTGVNYALDVWNHAEQTLSQYAVGWSQMHQQACVAARINHEQPERVLQLRNACLQERLAELDAVSRFLSRADKQTVERTPQLVEGLSPLKDCEDLSSLLAQEKENRKSDVPQARRDALGLALVDAKVLLHGGHYPDALASAKATLAEAERLHDAALTLKARLLLADVLLVTTETKLALEQATSALLEAERLASDRGALEATVQLGQIYMRMGKAPEANLWTSISKAMLARVGDDPEKQAHIALTFGNVKRMVEGDFAGAVVNYREGLALAQRTLGPEHSVTLSLQDNLGLALETINPAEAEVQLKEVLARATRARGPKHPFLVYPWLGLASVYLIQGRDAEAIEANEKALSLQMASGATGDILAHLQEQIGNLLMESRLPDKAERYVLDAQKNYARASGDGPDLVATEADLARVHDLQGDRAGGLRELRELQKRAAALPSASWAQICIAQHLVSLLAEDGDTAGALEAARDVVTRLHQRTAEETQEDRIAKATLASLQLQQGAYAQGVPVFRAAITGFEAVGGPQHPGLVTPLLWLGQAQAGLGSWAAAQSSLERALQLWEGLPGVWPERVQARRELARALREQKKQPERAQQLLAQADKEAAALPWKGKERSTEVLALRH